MSAHYAAPAIRRTQLATPPVRRKALFFAAAILCAPAFAALALAAFAASGGSDQPAMGSLTGTEGLRGTTTPSVSASPSPSPVKYGTGHGKGDWSDSTGSRHVQKHPSPQARPPAHRAPATPPPHVKPTPKTHVNTLALPTYDPTEPGAPISSGTTGTTSGTSGSGSGSSSGSSGSGAPGGPGGSASGHDAYPGGG
jgi:hypothetical protein